MYKRNGNLNCNSDKMPKVMLIQFLIYHGISYNTKSYLQSMLQVEHKNAVILLWHNLLSLKWSKSLLANC